MSDTPPIPFARPLIEDVDRDAVLRVLSGHVLTHGPECGAFEQEMASFLGGPSARPEPRCVSVSSCMGALHLACHHFGFRAGDEVIVPALTHVATVHAVEWTGARPVFVDCDPATGNVTAELIEAAVTERTRGIVLVHFAGIPCDMDAITALAARRGIVVIEDCALALGARWRGRHVGLWGDVGCYSFYPAKHMTTGEGGMLATGRAAVAAATSKTRAFGVDRPYGERALPGQYDVPELGLNYRMSELSAALGRSQLTRVGGWLERRRVNFAALRDSLTDMEGVSILDATAREAQSGWYCLVAVFDGPAGDRRDDLVRGLRASGVGTSIYYPHPVNRTRYYRERYGFESASFPAAVRISNRSVALPVGPHLGPGEIARVAEAVRAVAGSLSS